MSRDQAVTIGTDRYVIKSGGGYSCLGFDVCFHRVAELAARMGLPGPSPEAQGTAEQYWQYLEYVAKFSTHISNQKTWFDSGTPLEVQRVLENARGAKTRIRLFLGDRDTGRDWMEENDVVGLIGRSMGPMRVPLLLSGPRSSGGGAILTSCIVRIMSANGGVLYEHPSYHHPALRNVPSTGNYPWTTLRQDPETSEWEPTARHSSAEKAEAYLAFMLGQRMSQKVQRKAA